MENASTVETVKEQLLQWLAALRFPGSREQWEQHLIVEEHGYRVLLYTQDHMYAIVAKADRPGPDARRAYLGCMVSARKPRAGEDWTRGNDLADGPFSQETWDAILRDIVGYELLNLKDVRTRQEIEAERSRGQEVPVGEVVSLMD